jgi:DNA-binding NarL/FixJ family response regulator
MRILLADDHALFRHGLRLLLDDAVDITQFDEAGSLDAALELLESGAAPDLMLFDLRMPGMAGGATLRALRAQCPDAKLAVVSASEAREDILDALGAGAHGYIPKSSSPEQLVAALRLIVAGGIYVPPALAALAEAEQIERRPTARAAPPAEPIRLTDRQNEVMALLAEGMSTKEIARELDRGEGTVKIHLAAIYRALNARNRTEAVILAGRLIHRA